MCQVVCESQPHFHIHVYHPYPHHAGTASPAPTSPHSPTGFVLLTIGFKYGQRRYDSSWSNDQSVRTEHASLIKAEMFKGNFCIFRLRRVLYDEVCFGLFNPPHAARPDPSSLFPAHSSPIVRIVSSCEVIVVYAKCRAPRAAALMCRTYTLYAAHRDRDEASFAV